PALHSFPARRSSDLYDPATGLGHDPEGLVSTLPAIATVLLGVRAGDWLRRGRPRRLLGIGIAMLALGALWSLAMPFNKALWTSRSEEHTSELQSREK